MKTLHSGQRIALSRRSELLKINPAFYERAWYLLNTGSEFRQELINELTNDGDNVELPPSIVEASVETFNDNVLNDENEIDGVPMYVFEPLIQVTEGASGILFQPEEGICGQIRTRPLFSRSKKSNKKYTSELYILK